MHIFVPVFRHKCCLLSLLCEPVDLVSAKKLTEEELNALIAHAHRRIEQLQRQLAEQMAMETQRLEKALTQQQSEDEQLATQKVASEVERLKEEFLVEKEKWVRRQSIGLYSCVQTCLPLRFCHNFYRKKLKLRELRPKNYITWKKIEKTPQSFICYHFGQNRHGNWPQISVGKKKVHPKK